MGETSPTGHKVVCRRREISPQTVDWFECVLQKNIRLAEISLLFGLCVCSWVVEMGRRETELSLLSEAAVTLPHNTSCSVRTAPMF